MSSVRLRRAGAVLALSFAGGCGGPSPTKAPLSPPRAEPPPPRPSSSRVQSDEEGEKPDENAEPDVEIDDDDGDAPDRVSSTTARPSQCTFRKSRSGSCARLSSAGKGACAGSIAARACETWGPFLDETVVEKWLSCLSNPPTGSSACDGTETMRCALRAANVACVDGSLKDRCERIRTACEDSLPELSRSVCEHALSAFAPTKRNEIAACLLHGCDTGAFGSCIP